GLLSDSLLRFILIKNDGSILRSRIGALPVKRGGIVGLPKQIDDLSIGYFVWIVLYLNDFRMSRATRANILVSRIWNMPSRITAGYSQNSMHGLVNCFDTPEASTAEDRTCRFFCRVHRAQR